MEILWIALKLFWGKSNISMSLIFSHAFPKQPLNNFRSKKILNGKLHFLCSENVLNVVSVPFLYPAKTSVNHRFAGGIEMDDWHEMGYYT